MEINYSDGQEIEAHILRLVKESASVKSSENIASEHYDHWPVRYHLSSARSNLVRHLDWSGLDVLEIGAGMGAVSRYIAENCAHLHVIEGTQARFNVLKERLRDLDNWSGEVKNIQDATPEPKYDVVCLIGVLEYSELFLNSPRPFHRMLELASAFLKPDGVVLVAIENRLGVKYFAGCTEDHTSQLFDGVCGYSHGKSVRTFSRQELKSVLQESGFHCTVEHFPFPDYKMTSCVITKDLFERFPKTAAELSCTFRAEDYSDGGRHLFPASLFIESIAGQSGLQQEFANSFLFLSSRQGGGILAHLNKKQVESRHVAWHYTSWRRDATETVFSISDSSLKVRKRLQDDPERKTVRLGRLIWNRPADSEALVGQRLVNEIVRHGYFGESNKVLLALLHYINWAVGRFESKGDRKVLKGTALDALVTNAFVSETELYALFDQEWEWSDPIPKSWFVMRNILAFGADAPTLLCGKWESLFALYRQLCTSLDVKEDFERDVRLECELQASVLPNYTVAKEMEIVRHVFLRTHQEANYLRVNREAAHVAETVELRAIADAKTFENVRLNERLIHLEKTLDRKMYRLAGAFDSLLRKVLRR